MKPRASHTSHPNILKLCLFIWGYSGMTPSGTQGSWIKPGVAICKVSSSSAAFSLFLPLSE